MNYGTFNVTGRQMQNYRIKPGDTKSIPRTWYSNTSHTRGNIAHQCHTCHRSREKCSKSNHNFNYEFLQMLVGSDPFEMKACAFGQGLVGASLCTQWQRHHECCSSGSLSEVEVSSLNEKQRTALKAAFFFGLLWQEFNLTSQPTMAVWRLHHSLTLLTISPFDCQQ